MQDFHRALRAYTLDVNATTTTSEPSTPAFGANRIRLVSTVDCWVSTDELALTSRGAGIFLPARFPMFLRTTPGESLSFVSDSAAAGKVNITEMTT